MRSGRGITQSAEVTAACGETSGSEKVGEAFGSSTDPGSPVKTGTSGSMIIGTTIVDSGGRVPRLVISGLKRKSGNVGGFRTTLSAAMRPWLVTV